MAHYNSRMPGRRSRGGRGQMPISFPFRNQGPPDTFAAVGLQMNQILGAPKLPTATPFTTNLLTTFGPQIEVTNKLGSAARNNPFTNSPAPPPNGPWPPQPPEMRTSMIPNNPSTRMFFNSSRTFIGEPPFDQAAFARSIADSLDIYTYVKSGDLSFRVLTRTSRSGNGSSTVIQSIFPLNERDRAIRSLDITLLTTIPLALLIVGMGGAFLTDRALRPVRQITRTAEQISAEDLSRRLPTTTDDEFAQLAGTFNAMLARLETSFLQQRRFTADASHELKSPLTVIKANTSLALRMPRTPEEYVHRLEAIDKATNHMRTLVDDLLLLARADEGRLAGNAELISLRDILAEAVEATFRPDAVAVSFVDPESELILEGNRYELMRVFSNLLENAIRYTPTTGSVKISARDEGVAFVVSVEDTGTGIPVEHLAHLGKRFYRVDPSRVRTHGGSGLGLAICRSIIEAHGGVIFFHSSVGTGTTVTVTLPVNRADIA